MITIAAMAFAGVFLGVGIWRTVEFSEIGLSKGRRRLFIALHVLGCVCFAAALASVAFDGENARHKMNFGLFVGALLFLAPGQVMIALARKRQEIRAERRSSQ